MTIVSKSILLEVVITGKIVEDLGLIETLLLETLLLFSLSYNFPELTDVIVSLAVSVGTGVPVIRGGEGVYRGVGSVGVSPAPTSQGEHAAHSEARGTGARG